MSEHHVRRCIVCGRRENKRTLARFVMSASGIVFDREQTESGRGVYSHPTPECFSRLTDIRSWQRSLGRKGAGVSREQILAAVDDARAVLRLEFVLTEGTLEKGR